MNVSLYDDSSTCVRYTVLTYDAGANDGVDEVEAGKGDGAAGLVRLNVVTRNQLVQVTLGGIRRVGHILEVLQHRQYSIILAYRQYTCKLTDRQYT